MIAAEKVPDTGRRLGDQIVRQSLVGYFDAANSALHGAQHVVIDHQCFEAATHQTRLHAGGFADVVGAGVARQRGGECFLEAGLIVRQLGIAHACTDTGG